MTDYERPEKLKLEGDVQANFKLFRQEVEIYFTANETTKKTKEIQVARLLNLMGPEARKIYFQIEENIEEKNKTKSNAEEQLLTTQIVLGIYNKKTQQKLLENNLNLERTVQFCQSIELSEFNRQEIESTGATNNGNMSVYKAVKFNNHQQQQNKRGLGLFPEKCRLVLKDKITPIINTARRVPLAIKERLKDTLDQLEKIKVIEAVNDPVDWLSNIVIVEKPNKKLRICLDPQDLNRALKVVKFPITTLKEIIPKLKGKKFYTVIDLKDGFWQIALDEESNIIIYFDDIMISANAKEEHDNILEQVIQVARENNIKFNKDKIQFEMNEVKFLGFLFNENGMRPDPVRIKAINELQDPTNKTELQRILGMVNYLRDFIPNLSNIISPLRLLLKKDKIWCWNDIHSNVLKKIKNLIGNATTLVNFDPSEKVEIQCDASQDAIGCCLLQNKSPVCFLSRSLTETEKEYAQIEKELLSITYACKKLHEYIYGNNNIVIYTDHQPLVTDLLSRNVSKGNVVNDDESMNDIVHTVKIGEIKFSENKLEEYKKNILKDEALKLVCEYYKTGWPKNIKKKIKEKNTELLHYSKLKSEITMEGDLMYWNNRLLIPKVTRGEILNLLHETHLGVNKTKLKARQHCYWPGINSDIENFVLSCSICQKFSTNNSKEPLIQHNVPNIPFVKLGVDIAEWSGKKYFILVDYYSKWLEIIPIKSANSSTLIKCCKEIFTRFGIPSEVIADNMPFDSYEFRVFSQEYKFKITTSSPYYPRSNGLAEKFVGIAKKLIKKSEVEKKDLQLFLLYYRNSPVSGCKYSPSQFLMSRLLNTKLPVKEVLLKPKVINAKYELKIKKIKEKEYYDERTKIRKKFKVGEKVLVRDIKRSEWIQNTINAMQKFQKLYRGLKTHCTYVKKPIPQVSLVQCKAKNIPKQVDAYNCGVYVIYYAITIINKSHFDKKFNPNNYRNELKSLLLENSGDMANICLYCQKYIEHHSRIEWVSCTTCCRRVVTDCIADEYRLNDYKHFDFYCILCDKTNN
ncbi:uncharacterized protein K02A2.6-like [Daktulosphaira vitifoliae]|uniref:uncharacterized protein K02A2.6-like n=1 Tax=Daktulosphaira vitifoliae TaxID=58002 RepID=UPI0021A97887|nr:uncharacterized protein K02A2.6-like [Daktulosphaira vitifoliae]